MKTVLNEILEILEQDYEDSFHEMKKSTIIEVIGYIKDNMEIERKQILDAVEYGQNNNSVSISNDKKIADKYYETTYLKHK